MVGPSAGRNGPVGVLVTGQPVAVQQRIRAAFDRPADRYADAGRLRIPVTVKVAVAVSGPREIVHVRLNHRIRRCDSPRHFDTVLCIVMRRWVWEFGSQSPVPVGTPVVSCSA
jgi:hypothetical protein